MRSDLHTGFSSSCVAALETSQCLNQVLQALQTNRNNESLVLEYMRLLAVLCSDRGRGAGAEP